MKEYRTDSFTVFLSFFETAQKMNDIDRLAFYDGLFSYGFTGDDGGLEGVPDIALTPCKANIDVSISKRKSGAKGGNKKKEDNRYGEQSCIKAKIKQLESMLESKNNQLESNKEKEKEKDIGVGEEVEKEVEQEEEIESIALSVSNKTDNVSGKPDNTKPEKQKNEIRQIVNFLNASSGSSFKANCKNTQDHIRARLNEGYTVDDFKAVITTKCNQWLQDNEMSKYIRPDTLFRPIHFEDYLQEAKRNEGKRTVESNEDWGF